MKVKEILKKKGNKLITIEEDNIVNEAIKLMNKHKIGSLLVLNKKKKFVGIITERDLLRECERCEIILKIKVKDLMTVELITATPDDNVQHMMEIMAKNKIRHLPIVDNDNLTGIVSILDLVKYQLEDMEFRNQTLVDYIHG